MMIDTNKVNVIKTDRGFACEHSDLGSPRLEEHITLFGWDRTVHMFDFSFITRSKEDEIESWIYTSVLSGETLQIFND